METRRVELCEDEMHGWWWVCSIDNGVVCRSRQSFQHRWEALRDFDYQVEDHDARMSCRNH